MNDLEKLLRSDARQWQPPQPPAPDVDAALARAAARRSKLTAAAALVTVVALAAGGVVVADRLAGIPATPDFRSTPSAPTVTPSPDPTVPTGAPAGRLAELTDAVRAQTETQGVPAQVQAVATTWLGAREFLAAPSDGRTADEAPVWVVQAEGAFSCDSCQTTQQGPERSVKVYTMVLTAEGFDRILQAWGDETRPLPDLGEVLTLDPDGSTGMLSLTRAADRNGAQFGIPVTAEAVLTTWRQAQEFLPSEGGKPPGETEVWVVQLSGSFSCDDCQPTQTGPEPSVGGLILVLDAQTFDRYYAEPGYAARPLDHLGVVQALDLKSVA